MTSCLVRLLAVAAYLCSTTPVVLGSPRAEHVLIISIDGGKPAVIAQSNMPLLKRLAGEGACTWSAQTVFPSLTLPSHTSMLTGVSPEKHHVLWNAWRPRKGIVGVPTIFSEAKKAGLSTAMFVGKEKFRHLLQPGSVDKFEFNPAARTKRKKASTVPSRVVARQAERYIIEKKPNLCFIHFTDPDDAGHKYGWGSCQQIAALEDVDAALTEVLKGIESAGILEETVVIVTADHGGHAKTHGSKRSDDTTIPWIAWGKNVKSNYCITSPVCTCDTAATALWLLDAPYPDSLDGTPVTSAFGWRTTSVKAMPDSAHEVSAGGF